MKVFERLASNIAAEGVTALFGVMGGTSVQLVDALDRLGVKKLETRHEGVGCGMADGWARATRTPGVCLATKGPGVTQLATALVTAHRAGSPLVAIVAECAADDYENAHYFEQARFAAACDTAFVRVDSPEVADEAVRKAFYIARLESRPVMLSVPDDVQKMKFDDDGEYKPSSALLAACRPAQPASDPLERAA